MCAHAAFIYFLFVQMCTFSLFVPCLLNISPHSAPFLRLPLSLSPFLSLIAECEMTRGTRQSAGHTRLSGNEKWCWCQRWNRPNHPWAELHNSNIILLLPLLFYPLSLALSSGTLSLAHSQFKQIWFLVLYVPVTPPLLREACAGIGTRIKSPITARHAGKGQEVERQKHIYACEGACILVYVPAFYLCILLLFFFPLVCLVFVSILCLHCSLCIFFLCVCVCVCVCACVFSHFFMCCLLVLMHLQL